MWFNKVRFYKEQNFKTRPPKSKTWYFTALGFIAHTLFLSISSKANDDFFADIPTNTHTEVKDTSVKFSGFYQQHIKYGINTPDSNFQFERDAPGVWQIRSDFFVEIEKAFSDQLNLRFSTKAEIETYRWQDGEASWSTHNERLLLRDAFLDWTPTDDHWLRLGHQLFAWGDSEALPVIDVLSLRDQREFAQAELRDIREQIFAAQYSLPVFSGKLNLITSYRAGHNRYGESDDAFYPYVAFKSAPIRFQEKPLSNQFEFSAKYDIQFNGGDLSIVMADINDNDFAVEFSESDPTVAIQSQERVTIIGLAANRVSGSWLFKGELAQFFNQPVNSGLSFYTSDQTRTALGLEYNGFVDWFISYELNFIEQHDSPDYAVESSSKPGHAFHIRHTALHSRLQQNLWYFHFLDDQGSVTRWNSSYEWSDRLTLTFSAVFYDVPDRNSPFFPFRHHDSLSFSATINF